MTFSYKKSFGKIIFVTLFLIIGFFSCIFSVEAATVTWDGGGADTNWLTPANWVGDVAPTSTDSLHFTGTVRRTNNNDFATSTVFTDITFDATGFSLGGNPIELVGNITDSTATTSNTISLDININSTSTITVTNSGQTLTLSGIISGTGNLVKEGSGKLTLSKNNTFAGGVTANAGTTNATAGVAGDTITSLGLGTLILNDSSTLTLNNRRISNSVEVGVGTTTISGNGGFYGSFNGSAASIMHIGTGGFTMSLFVANSGFSGNILNIGSTIAMSNKDSLGTGILYLQEESGTSAQLSAGVNLLGANAITNNIVIESGYLKTGSTGNPNDYELAGVLSGPGGITISHNLADLTLSGANTFTGDTLFASNAILTLKNELALQNSTLNSIATTTGRLYFGSDGSYTAFTLGGLSGAKNIALVNQGSGAIELSVGNNDSNTTYSGVLSGIGSLNKIGSGELILSGLNIHTGTTTVTTGTLSLSGVGNNNIASSTVVDVISGATLDTTGLDAATDLVLANGQILKGEGTVNGNLTVDNGSSISPGESPGTINNIGDVSYAGGGNYTWEINDATGSMGTDPGWDLENISGALNITATSGNKFNINITSLTAGNISGNIINFDKYSTYTWTIASTSNGVSGFATSSFNLDATGFTNDISGNTSNGEFSIQVSGNELQLVYTGAVDIFTLSYTAGLNGSISGSSTQDIVRGNDGTAVTPTPALGYHFVDWSDASTDNPRTDTNVTADVSVTANFAINVYTLDYTAGAHGSLTGSTTQTINYGSDGTAVTAVPDTGYHFVDWSDASTTNPRTDTGVTGNISVTANFAINVYTLTYLTNPGGSLTGSTTQSINHGSDGTAVTAEHDQGFHFVDWSDASTDNVRTDTNVTANITVTANFEGFTRGSSAMSIYNNLYVPSNVPIVDSTIQTNKLNLSKNLTIGATGKDVVDLQKFLVAQGYLVMPSGVLMGKFGALTKAAVIKYQIKNNITPAIGFVGLLTRTAINNSQKNSRSEFIELLIQIGVISPDKIDITRKIFDL